MNYLSETRQHGQGRHILIVDDEPQLALRMQVAVQKAGHMVSLAYSGNDALQRILTDKPDLVVLDEVMPQQGGFEILKALRTSESTRDLPVILLTARAGDVDVFRGWTSGLDCYLTKPFHLQELVIFASKIFAALEGIEIKAVKE